MKILKLIIPLFIILLNFGCEKEAEQYDFERYKFVSFLGQEVSVPETYSVGNEAGYPIYLRYDGSTLKEDFTVKLKITPKNAKEGIDYSVETTTVLFKAGQIKSEPFYVKTIDDLTLSPEDRSLEIAIESVSNPKIDIGVGIVNQSNKLITLNIEDNECSKTIDVFKSSNLKNTNSIGSARTITGNLSGNTLTLIGDLTFYGAFPSAKLNVTLTPVVTGATIGKVTFNDFDAGTDNDGYVYQIRQVGEGTYDVCSEKINIVYTVYYISGGSWVYWKKCICVITTPQ
ncbi:DUF1735 domain-containing protein [Flavobacterium sp. ZB4P13]|uniref:DUF1735 domain-containing protein n=1 Tax=Flavobacterium sp. ZB4P13 TaxID=3401728 RepID=UPI003AB0776D